MHAPAEEVIKSEQLKAEFRLFDSLLLIFSLCSTFASLAGLTNVSSSPTINTVKIVVAVDGFILAIIGYCAAVLDKGSIRICSIAVVLSFLTVVQFVVRFVETLHALKGGKENNIYIPNDYDPTDFDVQFVAVMSFLSYAAFAVGYISSLGVVSYCMRNIRTGKLIDYTSIYFQ
jgi:hypothetical protein